MRKHESVHPDDLTKTDLLSELVLLGSGFAIIALLLFMVVLLVAAGVAPH